MNTNVIGRVIVKRKGYLRDSGKSSLGSPRHSFSMQLMHPDGTEKEFLLKYETDDPKHAEEFAEKLAACLRCDQPLTPKP